MRAALRTPIELVRSTAEVEDEFLWSPDEEYDQKAFVAYYENSENEVYFYLAAKQNKGIPPTDKSVWTKVGPSNRWAMFAPFFDSATITSDRLQVGFNCHGDVDVICLAGVVATYVNVSVYNVEGGSLLETVQIMPVDYLGEDSTRISAGDATFYNQFFEYFSRTYSSPYIYLDFVPITGTDTVCGKVFVGASSFLGETQYGANIGTNDYSKKVVDDFGVYEIEQGTYSRIVGGRVKIDDPTLDEVVYKLSAVTATPVFWDFNNPDTNYISLKVYGFPRSWNLDFGPANSVYFDVEINTPASKSEQTFYYIKASHLTGLSLFYPGDRESTTSFEAAKLSGSLLYANFSNDFCSATKVSGAVVVGVVIPEDPEWDTVSLLLPFEGDYNDYSPLENETFKLDGCYLDPTNGATGASSMYFSGVSSGLYTNHYPEARLTQGDFTIEFWVNPSSTPDFTVFQALFCKAPGFVIGLSDGGNPYVNIKYMDMNAEESVTLLSDSDNMLLVRELWSHLAFSKIDSLLYCFLNGTLVKSVDVSNAALFEPEMHHLGVWIGAFVGGSLPFTGNIDAVRLSYGLGRYSDDFTPSTLPFLTI